MKEQSDTFIKIRFGTALVIGAFFGSIAWYKGNIFTMLGTIGLVVLVDGLLIGAYNDQ